MLARPGRLHREDVVEARDHRQGDEMDVRALEEGAGVGVDVRDLEALGEGERPLARFRAHGHQLALRAAQGGEGMRVERRGEARADEADPDHDRPVLYPSSGLWSMIAD